MYKIEYSKRFVRAMKRCKKNGKDLTLLAETIELLVQEGKLPEAYKPHLLQDDLIGYWECHIEEDWLLVWKQNDKKLTLIFTNTGTHQELFATHKRFVRKE